MSSFNGLKRIAATSIQNTGPFILGNQLDAGTAGQVIVSNGANESAAWGTNSATLPNALTMGTNLSLASGAASFNGGIADTINAAVPTLTGGNGIDITGTTITTDNDGTKKIDATIGTYTIPQTAKWSAETIGPFDAYYSISTTDLFEALRCDGMNGKKSGRYTFRLDYNQTDNGKLSIETGDDIKGKTSVAIMGTEGQFGDRKEHFKGTKRDDIPTFTTIDLVFEGGLEESMKLMNGTVDIYFLHFTGRKGAGEYAMIISDGGPDPSFIFQTSLESTWKKR